MSSKSSTVSKSSGSVTTRMKIDEAVGYIQYSKSKSAHAALLENTLPKNIQKLMFSELTKSIGKRLERNSLIVVIVPIPDPDGDGDDNDDDDEDS